MVTNIVHGLEWFGRREARRERGGSGGGSKEGRGLDGVGGRSRGIGFGLAIPPARR